MGKRVFNVSIMMLAVVLASVITSSGCRADKSNRDARQLSSEFSTLLKNDSPLPVDSNSRAYQKLLDKFKNRAKCDEGELLKARIMIRLGKFDEASKTLAPLADKKSNVKRQALLSYTRALLCSGQGQKALRLFRGIEPAIKKESRTVDFYSAWLYFALYSPDPVVRETYGLKLINNSALPPEIDRLRPEVFRMLAANAAAKQQLDKAGEYLSGAAENTPGVQAKAALNAQKDYFKRLNKPAPALTAASWFNGNALTPESLKGKTVVVFFWAPWSTRCLRALPRIEELYREFKDKNTVFAGFTKLYGTTAALGGEQGPPASKEAELASIEAFIKNQKITFPVAVSVEGFTAEAFGVTYLPTVAVIDKKGHLAHMTIGSDPIGKYGYQWQTLKNKIKTIVEEK